MTGIFDVIHCILFELKPGNNYSSLSQIFTDGPTKRAAINHRRIFRSVIHVHNNFYIRAIDSASRLQSNGEAGAGSLTHFVGGHNLRLSAPASKTS